MERILEPEIMADPAQTRAYAQADFADSIRLFVDGLLRDFPDPLGDVIDLGCGPAHALVRLAQARPGVRITAVDGSHEMLKAARRTLAAAEIEQQVTLLHGYIPGLPLADHSYDAIISKDMLHHLPDPVALWAETRRLARPGAAVYVMDLFRRASREEALAIVESVSADEDPLLKADFFNSLCAAFTPAEVEEQLRAAGMALTVALISARHMLISGRL